MSNKKGLKYQVKLKERFFFKHFLFFFHQFAKGLIT